MSNNDVEIAVLKAKIENHDVLLTEIRDGLKEIPKELNNGFQSVVHEMKREHMKDVEEIRRGIEERDKKLKMFYDIASHPKISLLILALFIMLLMLRISDTFVLELLKSIFTGL